MVKAQELIDAQKNRNLGNYKTFANIFKTVEKKIKIASINNLYYVWYEIPEFIIGLPIFDIYECKKYIIVNMKANGFDIEEFESNIILIKWFPPKKK